MPSAQDSALIQPDHLLPVGDKRGDPILHQSSKITYNLWVTKGEIPWAHDSELIQQGHVLSVNEKWGGPIGTRFCIDPTRSRTSCGHKHDTQWVHLCASIPIDYILSVNENTRQPDEKALLYLSNGITYFLRAKTPETISTPLCIHSTKPQTFLGQRYE